MGGEHCEGGGAVIYYSDDAVTLYHGDCIEVLPTLASCSVDSIVTDPPYGLGFMGKAWDALPPGLDFARECLRVLKPGGHLLAFGGTRTWHRLAVAVEDAGFEIRDSIAWLYGQGFAKSLDVSKAIDKAAGAEREVVGVHYCHGGGSEVSGSMSGGPLGRASELPLTAPATEAARQWSGWGTALKPAHEPIVVARKPLASSGVNVLARVELSLREQGFSEEIRWAKRPANDAGKRDPQTNSSSTEARATAATSVAHAAESATPSDARLTGNGSATNTQHGEPPTGSTSVPTHGAERSNSEEKSSMHTAASAPVVVNRPPTSSPSTTSKAEGQLTARQPGARSTSKSGERDSRPVTEPFAGIATGLTGSRATVRIDRLDSGELLWPKGLPESVAGSPLTVAANVLEHGTGALNVDGCRIGTEVLTQHGRGDSENTSMSGRNYAEPAGRLWSGRWPANVVLDEDQAAALDQQSGTLTSGALDRSKITAENAIYGTPPARREGTYAPDIGGASRFFYTAKADSGERPKHNGIAHPTVKPLDLMRWLVRLVTPPGGLILEPFAGSGTTVEAAILEGFHCVAIEREADYLPLITQRINRRRDPVAYLTDAGEDLGLFDGGVA